ncbi:MAG: amidohydrolase family protein [Planctomycetes bacterium]|nr:amidohydrolase family protein [Planctomycetota bacterium]
MLALPQTLLCFLLGSTAAAASVPSQEPLPPVDAPLVITNIDVWAGPGKIQNDMTVVMLDAFAVEYRSDAVDPSEFPQARFLEAEADWILYPGMIHADFPSGRGEQPQNPYQGTATDPTTGPLTAMEYGDHRSFFAWMHVSDHADWNPDAAASWREQGFTSVYLLPNRGLVQGRAAHLALNGKPLAESIHQRDGHQLMSMRGMGGYPQTDMASLAVHRQLLLDQSRSDLSPDLQLGNRRIFRANSARRIENFLDLQEEFDHSKGVEWLILGGKEAWKHANRLRVQGIGVLYVIDFDEAPDSEEDLDLDDDEGRSWWQNPLKQREEQRREHAEQVAGFHKLKQAGVDCALVPSAKSGEFNDRLQQMVDAGLDVEIAYQALSTDMTELLGLSKLPSDFVISRGAYAFGEPQLAWVMSHGRAWEFEQSEDGDDDDDRASTSDADTEINGSWELVVESPMGEERFGAKFNASESTIEVFDLGNPRDAELASGVKFQRGRAKFDFSVPEPEMDVTVYLRRDGDDLVGKMKTPFGDVPMTGSLIDPQTAASSTDKKDDPSDQDPEEGEQEEEEVDIDLGHPQWPVETHADRLPHSEWALAAKGNVLLKGGTLYCMDGSEPYVGDLLIEGGLIAAVGDELVVPSGFAVVDASELHIMPGIIDAHSHLALDAINEGSVSISSECRVGDMIHAESVGIFRAAAGGATVVQSLHGSANPIGGQAATWELNYQVPAIADLLIPEAARNIKFALGENVKQSNWASSWGKRFPNSRLGVQAVYRRAFTAAEDYAERRRLANAGQMPNFRRDVRLEVLADILDNVVHIQCHSYRADELLMFIDICEQYGILGPTFQHVLEGYKVAPELAAAGAMASTFSDWWAYKLEVRDAIPWNVELMQKAGVIVSINSDSDEMIRRLNTEAAKAMLYGNRSWQEAMACCTINSAKQLRVDHLLGSLEVGKHGTISVFDGPPLNGYSRNVLSLARGVVLFEAATDRDAQWAEYGQGVADFALHLRALAAAESKDADNSLLPAPKTIDKEELQHWTANGLGKSYLIQGAIIHAMTEDPFVGSVEVKDGLIVKVYRGKAKIALARDMEIINANGKHLYPGFINCVDRTGIWEIGSLRASRDDIETGTDHPDLSTAAAIHADSAHHKVARKTGVAYVLTRPTSGRIRGKGALIQLDGVTTADMVVQKDLGLFIRFPRVSGFEQEDGPEVPDEVTELDKWFDDALEHADRMNRFADAERVPFDRDLRLRALLPFALGQAPVFLEANNAATLMAARTWAHERGLDVVYVGASEAWKVAGFLGADQARIISSSTHLLPRGRFAPYDSAFRNASVLRQAGCTVGLATDNPEVTRNLPFQAATEAAWGLDREASVRSITLDAARVLGVDAYVGSIEEGKVASLFLTSGDPLLIQDPVEQMWIGGRKIELESNQTQLRDRYLQRLSPAQR